MPRRSSSSSSKTLPRRDLPVKTAALSLSMEAGRPNVFEAEWNAWTGSADLTVTRAWETSATLDLSSRKLRISTGEESANCHGVESSCQVSLGSWASNRVKEDFGRLWGCGVISPLRLRIRHTVATDGTRATWPMR